jgi:hypothetical protein
MKKVWITNKSGHDFSPAEKFGQLLFLTSGVLPSKFSVNMLYRTFVEALENSSPNDYILIAGPSTALAVLVAIFAQKHGRVNFLIHDTKDNKYEERCLVLREEVTK